MLDHRSAIASNDANENAAIEWPKARALDPHGLKFDWKNANEEALAIESSLTTDGRALVTPMALMQTLVSAAILKPTLVYVKEL